MIKTAAETMWKLALMGLVLVFVACGGDGVAAPDESSIAGKWHISGRDIRLATNPTKCTLEADIDITAFAHEIDGAWSNGDFDCCLEAVRRRKPGAATAAGDVSQPDRSGR